MSANSFTNCAWFVTLKPTADCPSRNRRELASVDGRPPRPGDDSACDLKSVSPEPLAMLLPGRQRDYSFGVAGTKRTREGSTVMLDYKSVEFSGADDYVDQGMRRHRSAGAFSRTRVGGCRQRGCAAVRRALDRNVRVSVPAGSRAARVAGVDDSGSGRIPRSSTGLFGFTTPMRR